MRVRVGAGVSSVVVVSVVEVVDWTEDVIGTVVVSVRVVVVETVGAGVVSTVVVEMSAVVSAVVFVVTVVSVSVVLLVIESSRTATVLRCGTMLTLVLVPTPDALPLPGAELDA